MNRDDTTRLLKARSALTSQPYGPDAIDTWLIALSDWPFTQCHDALIRAAREHPTITVAHITARLPPRRPPDTPTPNRDPDEELLGPDHPRAQAALARGITEGRRELAAIRAKQATT